MAALGAALMLGMASTQVLAQTATSPQAQSQQQASSTSINKKALTEGLYETVYSAKRNTLYVAAAQRFDDGKGGIIFALDPETLAEKAAYQVPFKAFSLALDDERGELFIGNTMDARVSKFSLETGKVEGVRQLASKKEGEKYYPVHPRTLRFDSVHQRLYVTAVAAPGKLYVVDTRNMTLLKTINDLGKWTAGLAIDPEHQRAYTSNFDGRIDVIDTSSFRKLNSFSAHAEKPTNLALDAAGKLYVTDQESGDVVVLNAQSGEQLKRLHSGKGALALSFAKQGKVLLVTNREAGSVTELDPASGDVLNTFTLGANPNSLVIDDKSGALFVTIKQKMKYPATPEGERPPAKPDEIARITL
ncbi:YncE family protein [Carnimonas nigrificans]|uniref:YncE family protein n=1 Tax=Carnimonas nigrificans TaxID=64323 RepID=UPI0004715F10|nr:YncE family protein [Carnimonas nigrificans]